MTLLPPSDNVKQISIKVKSEPDRKSNERNYRNWILSKYASPQSSGTPIHVATK